MSDFIIIGVQKGGTTSAVVNLNQHPKISIPYKEIHFFDIHWENGIKWYKQQFPKNKKSKKGDKFKINESSINLNLGDKTPSLIYLTNCHSRMYQTVPQAKLILFLRNPIDRAYSQWNMNRSNQYNQNLSFEEAIDLELAQDEEKNYITSQHHYIQRGFYIDQINHLLEYYPRDQLLILISERVKRNMKNEYNKIYKFLGLKNLNAKYRASKKTEYPEPMKEETRNRLKKLYHPYNVRLFTFLGYKINEWN